MCQFLFFLCVCSISMESWSAMPVVFFADLLGVTKATLRCCATTANLSQLMFLCQSKLLSATVSVAKHSLFPCVGKKQAQGCLGWLLGSAMWLCACAVLLALGLRQCVVRDQAWQVLVRNRSDEVPLLGLQILQVPPKKYPKSPSRIGNFSRATNGANIPLSGASILSVLALAQPYLALRWGQITCFPW